MGRLTCTFAGCGRPNHSGGLCSGHRHQRRKGLPLTPLRAWGKKGVCAGPECQRTATRGAYCVTHYNQVREGRPLKVVHPRGVRRLCYFPGCGRKHHARGLCHGHWDQVQAGHRLHKIHNAARASTGAERCTGPGSEADGGRCRRKVFRDGICKTHLKQRQLKGVLSPVQVAWRDASASVVPHEPPWHTPWSGCAGPGVPVNERGVPLAIAHLPEGGDPPRSEEEALRDAEIDREYALLRRSSVEASSGN